MHHRDYCDCRTHASIFLAAMVTPLSPLSHCLSVVFANRGGRLRRLRQVSEQLQRAVEGAADGPAIATALKVTDVPRRKTETLEVQHLVVPCLPITYLAPHHDLSLTALVLRSQTWDSQERENARKHGRGKPFLSLFSRRMVDV